MKKNVIFVAFLWVICGTVLLSGDGFWTEIQDNSFRTGTSDVDGNISTPEILWKYYRGGYVSPPNAVVNNGNIYFSINGVVRAFDSSFNKLWETENFGAGRIFKITDIDKNGDKELVVSGTSGIRIVSAQTGLILSVISSEYPSFVKIADINDDGYEEIIVRGRWSVAELRAYSFAGGSSLPVLLWEINENIPRYGLEIAVGDLNNDGNKEMIMDRITGGLISVFNSSDGTLLRDKPRVLEGAYAYGLNQIINVDSDVQKEFIFTGTSSTSSSNGSYVFAVYDFVEDSIQWKYEYGKNTANKGLRIVPGSIDDFNGDGIMDVVVSVFNDTMEGTADLDGVNVPDIWTTLIYRADNGLLQAKIDNMYLEGIADLDGNGTSEFILKSVPDASKKMREYSTISAYGFADGDFRKFWSKDKLKVVKIMPEDTEDAGVTYVTDVPATVSIGIARGIIVIEDINLDGIGDKLFSMSGTGSSASTRDVTYLLDGKSFGFISATDSNIFLSGNEGYIHIFDRGPALGNEKTVKTGNFNGDVIYINSSNGGKILTTSSTYSHVLLDLDKASAINQPEMQWSQINQYGQPLFSFDSNGDGSHEFISLYTDSDGYTDIYLHGSNGGLLWGWTSGKIITAPSNFLTGDFDGDGFKDIAFTFTSEEEGDALYSLKGSSGDEIGSYFPAESESYNYSSVITGDINGDGSDDMIIFHAPRADIISGISIEKQTQFAVNRWAHNPFVADFTGDGIVDIFANQAQGDQKQAFDLEGNEIWKIDTSMAEDSLYQYYAPYPGISKIDADEGYDIALGGKFGDVSAYSGADGSVLWRRCLSNGISTDISVSMIPTSGLCSGTTLSNIVTGDIDGDSIDEFVVGDKQGNLYVINSEDGTLAWTMKFDGAIGNPVLADVNNDGKIEIVTGAGDGYLYAIGQKPEVTAPSFVRDVEVNIEGDISGTADIDEMITGSSYGGLWQAVTGALKYQVRLTKADETVLRETQVTGANQVVFSGLEVEVSDVLYLSVKTIDAGGYESDWKKSDGISITDGEIISDDDVMPDNDDEPDHDIFPDTDMDSDIEYDEDAVVADTDIVKDEDVTVDADEDADIADDNPEIKSKDSGCGCSVL